MLVAHLCNNRRIYIRQHRIHHGAIGCALTALGLALIFDDWHDRPWHWKDPAR